MLRQINIQLIDKIKKTKEVSTFINGLLKIVLIILYPIIIFAGLITMLFVGLFSIFQNLTKTKDEKISFELTENISKDKWAILAEINGLKIFQKFKGEVRYGPYYLTLKSEPTIQELDNKVFGDWFFQYKNGLLLQQWNSTNSPNTNLLFIDTDTLEIQTIEKNISSVLWDIIETEDKTLQLKCDTGQEILTYKIEIKKAAH